jgi:hypothetical protein
VLDLAQYLALIEEVSESDPLFTGALAQVKLLYEKESARPFRRFLPFGCGGRGNVCNGFRIQSDESSGRIMTDILVSIADRHGAAPDFVDYSVRKGMVPLMSG